MLNSPSAQSPPLSIRLLLSGLWVHITQHRRIQLCLLLLLMLISAVAELVSLGAVLPFLGILSNPDLLWKQQLVRQFAITFGITKANQLLGPATLCFAVAVVSAALIRLINLWSNGQLAAAIGSDLSCEAYRRTLYQPYTVHVRRNSAAVITAITSQINFTVMAINAFLKLTTAACVAIALLAGLLIIDASVAISALIIFGAIYAVLAIIAKNQLRSNSQRIAEASTMQLKSLQEGLGSIRDVLLNGNQSTYLEIYKKSDIQQRVLQAKNIYLGSSPRYVLEASGMVAIAFLGLFLVSQSGSGVGVIPLLGAMALGAQRLLPALQQVYKGWAALKGYSAAIHAVLEMLDQPMPPHMQSVEPFPLRHSIQLDQVQFCYSYQEPKVLKGITLSIQRGERLGLIGDTGSGKSTLIDLIMGLLEPISGKIFVDGLDLHDHSHPEILASWRAAISHVPQEIYLADGTIAENIAFGIPPHQIDMVRVRHVASQAQLASFIESSQGGYQSFVGERGICLSGGQRQRIGIARALYKQSKVLVFDEATSALDTGTERSVMEAIEGLSQDLTIIMIAHRLSTLEKCDRVIKLNHGIISFDSPPEHI